MPMLKSGESSEPLVTVDIGYAIPQPRSLVFAQCLLSALFPRPVVLHL